MGLLQNAPHSGSRLSADTAVAAFFLPLPAGATTGETKAMPTLALSMETPRSAFLQIPKAEMISQMPAYARQDRRTVEMAA